MLIDILKRHAIESKRTSDFLKYALSSRSREPGVAPMTLYLRSTSEQKLPRLKEASTYSGADVSETLFSVDKAASASKTKMQVHSELKPTKLPKLMNNKSLIEEEQPTIDQTQDSQAIGQKGSLSKKRSSLHASSRQSSLFAGQNNHESPRYTKHIIQNIKQVGSSAKKSTKLVRK